MSTSIAGITIFRGSGGKYHFGFFFFSSVGVTTLSSGKRDGNKLMRGMKPMVTDPHTLARVSAALFFHGHTC